MSRQRSQGTRFETAVARYARMRTGDQEIDRLALHGAQDYGDVGYIRRQAGGRAARGIVECKNYRPRNSAGTPPAGLLRQWQEETAREMRASRSDFAILVVHRKGKSDRDASAASFGLNWAWATARSLYIMSGRTDEPESPDAWVCMTLEDAFDLIDGSKTFEL